MTRWPSRYCGVAMQCTTRSGGCRSGRAMRLAEKPDRRHEQCLHQAICRRNSRPRYSCNGSYAGTSMGPSRSYMPGTIRHRPGRPEGGEAMAMRAYFALMNETVNVSARRSISPRRDLDGWHSLNRNKVDFVRLMIFRLGCRCSRHRCRRRMKGIENGSCSQVGYGRPVGILRETVVALVRRDGPDLSARQLGVFLTCYLRDGGHTVRGWQRN